MKIVKTLSTVSILYLASLLHHVEGKMLFDNILDFRASIPFVLYKQTNFLNIKKLS